MASAENRAEIAIRSVAKPPSEKAQAPHPELVSAEIPAPSGWKNKDMGIANTSLDDRRDHEKEEGDVQITNQDSLEMTLDDTGIVDEIKEGMTFSSEIDAQNYYRKYARWKGFGVIRRSSKRGDDGTLTWLMLACARSRKYQSIAKNPLRRPPSAKTECKARAHIAVNPDGSCRVCKVVLDHNHGLGPTKVRLSKRNKMLDSSVRRRLELIDQARTSTNKSFDSSIDEAGGYPNLTSSEKDFGSAKSHVQNYKMMCNSFSEVADLACDSGENVRIVMRAICDLKEKIHKNKSKCGSNQLSLQDLSAPLPNYNADNEGSKESDRVLSPVATRRRGRPPKRKESTGDPAMWELREKKKKQKADENQGSKEKRKKVNENEQVDYDGSDACPNLNVTQLVNEIGTQECIMGNPNTLVGTGYMRSVFNYPNLSPNPLQGQSIQMWRGGYGTGNFLQHNFNGN